MPYLALGDSQPLVNLWLGVFFSPEWNSSGLNSMPADAPRAYVKDAVPPGCYTIRTWTASCGRPVSNYVYHDDGANLLVLLSTAAKNAW